MTPRAAYFVEILRQIGAPLMAHAVQSGDTTDIENTAKTVASKLSQSVETGITLSGLIDLGAMGETDDSLRLAMTGLAAKLIKDSGQKNITEKILKDCVNATLGFADNFTPDALNTQRLQDLAAKGQVVDLPQIHVQYLHAFIPVINVVQDFAFGQPIAKLMSDIASRLSIHAKKIAKTISDTDDALEQKRIAVGVMEALCQIYTATHQEQIAHLKTASDDVRDTMTMDVVWGAFNQRLELVKVLINNMTGEQNRTSETSDNSSPITLDGDAKQPDMPKNLVDSEAVDESLKPLSEQEPSNPMSIFAKKPASTPALTKKTVEVEEPPVQPTPKPDIEDQGAPSPDNDSDDSEAKKSNPMSFFKTPPPDE